MKKLKQKVISDYGSWESFVPTKLSSGKEKEEGKEGEEEEEEGLPEPTDEIRAKWVQEQEDMCKRISVLSDDVTIDVRRVAGVDISFVKDSAVYACVAVVVLEYPSQAVVYEGYEMVKLQEPYIPGFLGFREVPFFAEVLRRVPPECAPQLVLVDGNGVHHPRGCGSASQLGVLLGVPTVGVAKKFLDADGLRRGEVEAEFARTCGATPGASMPLRGRDGRTLGMALRPPTSHVPLYVSVGHAVSLRQAVEVVLQCCVHRVPEPIRQADLRSRAFLRDHHFN